MTKTPSQSETPAAGLDPSFDIDAQPRVAESSSLWPVTFGILGALALGAVVFLQLSAARTHTAEAQPEPQAAIATFTEPPPPPSYFTEPLPVAEPPPVVELQPEPPPAPPGPTQAELDRLRAPALVVDLSEYKAPPAAQPTPGGALDAAAVAGTVTGAANAGAASPDERFAQRFGVGGGSSKPTQAVPMGDLSLRIIEGAVIPAVLETALNSDVPGYARAVVTRDVRGFDGTKVLVPRGSRLIGQYKAGVALGQSRAFVIWTRLIRPDGATVELASPATDALGRGGIGGSVDRHFFQRFGGAILLTLLNVGGSAISDSTDTTVVIAGARAGTDAAGSAFAADMNIGPTVTVPQGSPVRVFVSQDIDFSAVGPTKPTDSAN